MRDELWTILVAVGGAAVIGLAVCLSIADETKWRAYRDAHHCVPTGHIEGSSGVGVSGSGEVVVTTISGKILWKCDGGELIGRDE